MFLQYGKVTCLFFCYFVIFLTSYLLQSYKNKDNSECINVKCTATTRLHYPNLNVAVEA